MSRLSSLAATILNYRPGEGRLLGLLLVLFFLKGICDVFFATSASTLYLQQFGSVSLPYVYLASALVVTILGLGYSRLTTRVPTSRLLKITLVFVAGSIGALHLSMVVATSRWWTMALMVWREVLYMLLNATFWAQVGLLLNVRQGKRLFPVIAGGDIVSAAIGGAVIPVIVRHLATLHLLFFAEASIALCLVVSAAIDRAAPATTVDTSEDVAPDTRPLGRLVRERYLALFFGVSIVSYLIYFFADYNFYDVVNRRFADAAALASFFGLFYAALNAVNLVLNGVIAGRLLTRYGIAVGLLAVPLLVGLGTVGALVLPAIGISALFFWAIIGTKLADEMLRGAFLYPTYKILYQPLPPRERIRVQAVRDSIVEPVAVGLSGALLLALTRLAGFQVPQLGVVLLIVLALFTALSVALRREYVVVLGHALSRRRRMEDSSLLANAESLQVLRRGIRSEKPVEAIYCLGLLEEADPAIATGDLLEALSHGETDVRAYAMRRLREMGAGDAVNAVQSLVEREREPEVLEAALWTLGDLSRGASAETLAPFLDHEDARARRGAMIGLLRHPGNPAETEARTRLDVMIASAHAGDRAAAARIIGDVGPSAFGGRLVELLADVDTGVVRAALAAAGLVRDPALLPAVSGHLDDPELRDGAAAAVVQFGDAGVPLLVSVLEGATRSAEAVRMIRILGRTGTPAALAVLLRNVKHPDENIRHVVLQTLARDRFVAGPNHAPLVREALQAELQSAAWLLAARQDVGGGQTALVGRALDNDVAEATDRMLLLLSFLYSRQTVLNARTLFRHGTEEQRAQALEAVDNLLPRNLTDPVLPLLDDLSVAERLARIGRVFAQPARGAASRLADLMGGAGPGTSQWSRACAVYEGARLGAAELLAPVRAAADDADPLVRETAAGAGAC